MRYAVLIFSLFLTTAIFAGPSEGGKHSHERPHPGKHLFDKADTDNDGNVSIDEHEAALSRMVEHRREKFRAMDTNEDGLVSKEEAKKARKDKHKKRHDKHSERHNES